MKHGILGLFLLILGTASANAGTITWHWAGPVTGYVFPFSCAPGEDCGPSLAEVVPLGTPVDVFVTFDPLAPSSSSFSTNCLWEIGSASFQVLGRTYTGLGHVWVDAMGFGPGICAPGSNRVEVVVPVWGASGPALPGGWVPFEPGGLPGLWWGGDLADGQPASIASQFPTFAIPLASRRQRFEVNLQAVPADMQPVPEPTTWLLFSTGLAAAAWRRRRS